MSAITRRVEAFCSRFGLRVPMLLAPMAGVPAPNLSIAVGKAGALGACAALLMTSEEITAWATKVRSQTAGGYQINLWVPDPPPARDPAREKLVRDFLSTWGPPVAPNAGDATPPDFAAQCAAILEVHPAAASSVMGLFPPEFRKLHRKGIPWFATATTVTEAKLAEAAGADVIVAQGMEAGGHRGCFNPQFAESQLVGLFALIPAVVDAVRIPVVATGGIADSRGVAAALHLGASTVQIGTAFLRCPEAEIPPAWARALAVTRPEDTAVSRVFSGRSGRSILTDCVRAASTDTAPQPAPYPVQRGLTAGMRAAANKSGDLQRLQAWAGQSAALARAEPAQTMVSLLWSEVAALLQGAPIS
jgi:nitronate monooxygenase